MWPKVVREEISLPVRSIGIVATSEEIRLSFKTGGIIAHAYVNEGQSVKAGQLLAELNLSEITAQVNQAENGYEKALRDFTRAKNLFADSVATLEQYQNAETGLNVAKSILDAAQFNLVHSRIKAPAMGSSSSSSHVKMNLWPLDFRFMPLGSAVKTGSCEPDFRIAIS